MLLKKLRKCPVAEMSGCGNGFADMSSCGNGFAETTVAEKSFAETTVAEKSVRKGQLRKGPDTRASTPPTD